MKRDDMNIDEVLRQCLPRAPQDEVDAASATVLKRIREMRFQAEPEEASAAQEPKKMPEVDWMHDYHVAALVAVAELQGYGDPVRIILKMREILEEYVTPSWAFINLLIMEKMGLISSTPIDPEKPQELDHRHYAITAFGRDSLAKAFAVRDRVAARARRLRLAGA